MMFLGPNAASPPKNTRGLVDCITVTANGDEANLRTRLTAPAENIEQDLYVSEPVKTGRVMVKDEDVCLHCGLCAERCPTGAWDMRRFLFAESYAGRGEDYSALPSKKKVAA